MSVKLKEKSSFCHYYNEICIEFVSVLASQALQFKYEETKKSIDPSSNPRWMLLRGRDDYTSAQLNL